MRLAISEKGERTVICKDCETQCWCGQDKVIELYFCEQDKKLYCYTCISKRRACIIHIPHQDWRVDQIRVVQG